MTQLNEQLLNHHSVERTIAPPLAGVYTHEFTIQDKELDARLPIGLGQTAVAAKLFNSADNIDGVESNPISEEILEQQIDFARFRLEMLQDETKCQRFNYLLSKEFTTSEWLIDENQLSVSPDENGIIDYIGALKRVNPDGSPAVPDELFLNFLEWHNSQLSQRSERFERENGEQLASQVMKLLESACRDGWMNPALLETAKERFSKTRVILDDGFLTSQDAKHGFAIRFAGSGTVLISPELLQAEPQAQLSVFTHEMMHILEGVKSVDADDPTAMSSPFGTLFTAYNKSTGHVMREAIVEHTSQSLINGKVDRIYPDNRPNDDGTYALNRILLFALARMGKQEIDIRDFIDAHFEPPTSSNGVSSHAVDTLKSKLEKAFPNRDIISDINTLTSKEGVISLVESLAHTRDEPERKHL